MEPHDLRHDSPNEHHRINDDFYRRTPPMIIELSPDLSKLLSRVQCVGHSPIRPRTWIQTNPDSGPTLDICCVLESTLDETCDLKRTNP